MNLDKKYNKMFDELEIFFDFNWSKNRPKLIILESKEERDSLLGEKSEDWICGWTEGIRRIYVLDRRLTSFSESGYLKLIKHELVHSFTKAKFSARKGLPAWVWEGLAMYLSGQLENNFPKRGFRKFLSSNVEKDYRFYLESGLAIKYLVKKFGKGRLFQLIIGSSKRDFKDLFAEIYIEELTYDFFVKDMRIKLIDISQKKFLDSCIEKLDCVSLRGLLQYGFNIKYDALKSYYSNRRLFPKEFFENLIAITKLDKPEFEIVSENWGQVKGGKRGKRKA